MASTINIPKIHGRMTSKSNKWMLSFGMVVAGLLSAATVLISFIESCSVSVHSIVLWLGAVVLDRTATDDKLKSMASDYCEFAECLITVSTSETL